MTDRASHQEIGRRIEALLDRRGLTHEALAERVGVDVGTVGRWVRGEQQIRSRNLAKVGDALDVELYELRSAAPQPNAAPGTGHSERDLRTVDFITWIADNSDQDFADLYQAVADRADQLEARPTASRHSKSYTRAKVSRQDLTAAVADYYDLSHEGAHLYQAEVAGLQLTLSIATKPDWTDLGINLRDGQERASLAPPSTLTEAPLPDAVVRAGIARLADAEVHGKVLVNNPMYRLVDIEAGPGNLHPTFGRANFADYALRNGLMEVELIDAIAGSSNRTLANAAPTPVRDRLLPTAAAAFNFESYYCTGGPVGLVAIARPARGSQPADYALLVQVRGHQVMDIPGKLSTIPKGWHQPLSEASSEAKLSTTLLRELEEELFGREDLEQMSDESRRAADPLHQERQPEAMRALLQTPDALRVTCTGFGINLLSGTYEVPCLVTIEDESWWSQWGHQIAGNWETTSVETYSSMDTDSLTAVLSDPRWSNEGLFSLIQGLRYLAKSETHGRVAVPTVQVG